MNKTKVLILGCVIVIGFIIIDAPILMADMSAKSYNQKFEYIVLEIETWAYKNDDERKKETTAKYPKEFGIWTSNPNSSNNTTITCLPALDQATTLNEMGKLGWELVTVSHNNETGKVFGYFKRQIKN